MINSLYRVWAILGGHLAGIARLVTVKYQTSQRIPFGQGARDKFIQTESCHDLACFGSTNTKAKCPLFSRADVQVGRNWMNLGAAFGQERTSRTDKTRPTIA